ncbi:MAG: peptidylprolyl isomerase [Deltaproteobacteria bacterium]|nr:peptidylprolyl isomerase [Deltaproteobacteria bacterium]
MVNCKAITIGFVFLFIGLACSNQGERTAQDQVVIRVDNQVVTLGEFNEYFEPIGLSSQSEDGQDKNAVYAARISFLLQLVEEMIIMRRAEELHLSISPEELDEAVREIQKDYPQPGFEDMFLKQAISFEAWKERLRKRLLVEKVMRKDLLKEDSVTIEEMREYYNIHREEWSRGEEIRARQILLPTEDQAKKVLQSLQNGEAFSTLARRHSIAPEAQFDGDLGYVVRGQLPSSLEAPLFDLDPGDVSSVVKTPYGFHIFQVVEKRETPVPNIDESIERIKQEILKGRLKAAYGPWLAELRSRYDIEVNTEMI